MLEKMHQDKNGKPSNKRFWGTVLLTAATLMTIAGGLGWYDPNADMVSTMFYMGSGLLGIGVFENKK